jgi:hypothetical protein
MIQLTDSVVLAVEFYTIGSRNQSKRHDILLVAQEFLLRFSISNIEIGRSRNLIDQKYVRQTIKFFENQICFFPSRCNIFITSTI